MSTLSLHVPVGVAARAVYAAAEGLDDVLVSHASEEFVGFRLGRSARVWAWVDAILRQDGDGTSVRVVSRLDELADPADPTGQEQVETGHALVVRALEEAERQYNDGS